MRQQQIFAHICMNIAYTRQYADMRIGKKWRMAIPNHNPSCHHWWLSFGADTPLRCLCSTQLCNDCAISSNHFVTTLFVFYLTNTFMWAFDEIKLLCIQRSVYSRSGSNTSRNRVQQINCNEIGLQWADRQHKKNFNITRISGDKKAHKISILHVCNIFSPFAGLLLKSCCPK